MSRRDRRWLALAALLALLATPEVAGESRGFRFSTLEGEVRAVGEVRDEGELELLSVDLAIESQPGEEVKILLGPVDACREIGLVVEEGDRLRARVFLAEEGEPLKAQKVLNLSRSIMVRLRTMHDVPLWSSAGTWQGGPGRQYRGGQHGARHGSATGPGRRPGSL